MPERTLAEQRDAFYLVARGGTAATNSVVFWTCIDCGALVEEQALDRHAGWHLGVREGE